MERGTLASISDLTWKLPHWLNCFLSILLGDMYMYVCACAWTRMREWMNFMNENSSSSAADRRWDHLVEMENPPPTSPLTHPPIMVGAHLNESHQWTILMKHTVVATWLMSVLSNISFPRQTGTDHSIVHIDTDIHKHTQIYLIHTYLSSFIGHLKDFLCNSTVGFQSIWCWSRVPIIFASFVHVPFRNRVEWIWWLATYSAVCEWKWQWLTQGALHEDP